MNTLIPVSALLSAYVSPDESSTSFAKLSQEAQDAIVWAILAPEGETPPDLTEAVKDEIRLWAETPEQP